MLGFFGTNFNDFITLTVLPIVLSLLILLLFMIIINTNMWYYSTILVLSPVFVNMFFVLTNFHFAILLGLIGIYFLKKNNKFSYLFFLMIVFLPIINLLMLFLFFIFYFIRFKPKKDDYFYATFVILVGIFHHIYLYSNYGLVDNIVLSSNLFVVEFGAVIGFSIIALILMFYNVITRQSKLLFLYFIILSLLSFIFGEQIHYFTNFIVVYFAGESLYKTINANWNYSILKSLTIVSVICGLFIASFITIDLMKNPNNNQIEAFLYLKKNTNPDNIIFSNINSAGWLKYFSNRKVFLSNKNIDNYDFLKVKYDDFLYTRDINLARTLIDEFDIDYIYLDNINNLYSEDDEGLLFVLTNKESFDKVYENTKVSIWKVLK